MVALAPGAPSVGHTSELDGVEVRRFTYFLPRRLQKLAYGGGIPANIESSRLARLQLVPYLLAQMWATSRLVRSQHVQVVNSHWMIPQGLSAALVRGRRPRFKHVVTLHSGDVYMLRRLPLGRWLARFIAGRTDLIFAVSSNVRDVLDELLGRPSNALVQPVGVHTELFRAQSRSDPIQSPYADGHLLFVGRLDEIKGVQYLLEALPQILKEHPGLGLVVVGYGPYRLELERRIEQLGLSDRVELVGEKPHLDVARHLHGARAVVVPSIAQADGRTEGMPTVAIEAMAAGALVVASAVGGLSDLIRHEQNGWLCLPRDPDDLASKVLAALASPSAASIRRAAQETAAKMDWKVVAKRYAQAFESLATA